MKQLWFSIYDRNDYQGEKPYFIESGEHYIAKFFESNYNIVKDELLEYINQHELPSYFNSTMVETKNTWKTISLSAWDVEVYENHKYFPKTLSLVKSCPNIVSSSFSMMAPYSKILPHCGDTNGIYRCHLALSIPARMPECGFRVGDEWQSWVEGKMLMFVDANNHEAINNTSENRFIMIIDVIRPEVLSKKRLICATVLTSLFLQKLAEKFSLLYKTPLWFQYIIAKSLVPLAYIAIPIRNFLYKFKK